MFGAECLLNQMYQQNSHWKYIGTAVEILLTENEGSALEYDQLPQTTRLRS